MIGYWYKEARYIVSRGCYSAAITDVLLVQLSFLKLCNLFLKSFLLETVSASIHRQSVALSAERTCLPSQFSATLPHFSPSSIHRAVFRPSGPYCLSGHSTPKSIPKNPDQSASAEPAVGGAIGPQLRRQESTPTGELLLQAGLRRTAGPGRLESDRCEFYVGLMVSIGKDKEERRRKTAEVGRGIEGH